MKTILILAIAATLTGCATIDNRTAAVALEFRPASQSPGPGLTEMMAPGSERPVYVSNDILLSNADVESARVISGPMDLQIEVMFTTVGAEHLATLTENNLMKPLAILVDGQLISAPIVRDKIFGGRAVIAGSFSEEEAERIANGIDPR